MTLIERLEAERDADLARAEIAEKRPEEAKEEIAAMAKSAKLLLGYTLRKADRFLQTLEEKP